MPDQTAAAAPYWFQAIGPICATVAAVAGAWVVYVKTVKSRAPVVVQPTTDQDEMLFRLLSEARTAREQSQVIWGEIATAIEQGRTMDREAHNHLITALDRLKDHGAILSQIARDTQVLLDRRRD